MEDKEAYLHELFVQYHDALKKYCASLIHHDCRYMDTLDDCVQEAFYKAVLHYEDIHNCPNTFGWLANCCKNYYRSNYRKIMRRNEIIGVHVSLETCGDVPDPMDSVIRWMIQTDASDLIDEIVVRLTPMEKIVFNSYFKEHNTARETAQSNHISDNSVLGALQRIRKKASTKTILVFFILGQFILHCSRTI